MIEKTTKATAAVPSLPKDNLTLDQKIGIASAELLLAEAEWIHRRVESLVIGADLLARRHLSIDFTVPDDTHEAGSHSNGHSICYLPLSFIRKTPSLVWFDLRNEEGHPLPLMTKRQNTEADIAALHEFSCRILGFKRLPPRLSETLRQIVLNHGEDSEGHLQDITQPPNGLTKSDVNARARLASSARFMDLATQLINSRFLWVPVPRDAGRRRIVKLAYEIPTPNRLGLFRFVGAAFGASQTYWIEGQHMGNQSSYHLTVVTPDYLEILEANLILGGEGSPVAERQVERHVAHMHVTGTRMHVPALGWASVRVERQGYLSTAALTCLLVSAMMFLFTHFHTQALASDHLEPTVTVLLVVPAILVAFLARPTYILADRRLLVGLRLLVSIVGVFAVAASVFAIALSDHDTYRIWHEVALATGAIGGLHVLAVLFPRSRRTSQTV